MEDKLMTEAQLREQNRMLATLVRDLAYILDEVLGALPAEFRELENVNRAMALTENILTMLNAVPKGGVDVSPPPVEYMSGRWKRLAGDIYGVVRQPGVRRADNPPGDIRPPDQR